jgi:cobyrinic acid a,c-diamide synthase
MDQEEIRHVLRKKEGGKIDSYIQQKAKKKEEEIDLKNLMKIWTHSLLYHKNIYPPEAFAERQLLGQKVFVATAESLRDYLDDFFDKLQPHIAHLNHLQILLTTPQGDPF